MLLKEALIPVTALNPFPYSLTCMRREALFKAVQQIAEM